MAGQPPGRKDDDFIRQHIGFVHEVGRQQQRGVLLCMTQQSAQAKSCHGIHPCEMLVLDTAAHLEVFKKDATCRFCTVIRGG